MLELLHLTQFNLHMLGTLQENFKKFILNVSFHKT